MRPNSSPLVERFSPDCYLLRTKWPISKSVQRTFSSCLHIKHMSNVNLKLRFIDISHAWGALKFYTSLLPHISLLRNIIFSVTWLEAPTLALTLTLSLVFTVFLLCVAYCCKVSWEIGGAMTLLWPLSHWFYVGRGHSWMKLVSCHERNTCKFPSSSHTSVLSNMTAVLAYT